MSSASVCHRSNAEPISKEEMQQQQTKSGAVPVPRRSGFLSSPTSMSNCIFGRFSSSKLRDDSDLSFWALVERHRFLLCTMSVLFVLCTVYLYFAISMGEEYALCDRLKGSARKECHVNLLVKMGQPQSHRRKLREVVQGMGILGEHLKRGVSKTTGEFHDGETRLGNVFLLGEKDAQLAAS